METEKITYEEKIEEEVKLYKKLYKTLVRVGNKHPAEVIAYELKMRKFVMEETIKQLMAFFEKERTCLKIK